MSNEYNNEWQFACSLLELLDAIERQSDDEDVIELTRQRFDIAEKHGLSVHFEDYGAIN